MQVIDSVVDAYLVILTVKREFTFVNTVTIATNDRTSIAITCLIPTQSGITEDNICHIAITISSPKSNNASSKVGYLHSKSVNITNGVQMNRVQTNKGLKIGLREQLNTLL